LLRRHLQLGVTKGALTQEVADQRFQQWLSEKDAKIEAKKTGLVDTKAEARAAALAAETKVKEARATALAEKQAAALAAATPAPAAAEGDATEGSTETAETSAEAAA
jgi:small subunit ribosomal protein S16